MRRRWVYNYRFGGKRRELGLGGFPAVTLADARKARDEAEKLVRAGKDPISVRESSRDVPVSVPNFAEAAEAFIATKSSEWRNEKHAKQWAMTLTRYCKQIARKPVNEIETAAVLAVLKPLWGRAPETARRLRGRIEAVLDAAAAHGHIPEGKANPARWKGHLAHLLPKRQKLTCGHHPAMDYKELPGFMAALRDRNTVSCRALEWTILTAARTNETLGATWDEIDFEAGVWTVPAKRMKAGREHKVPICSRALSILAELKRLESKYVFPSRSGKSLSNMAMQMVLRRMGHGNVTTHGMRSAFRDWAGNETNVSREVCEAALAHTLQGVEAAYRRGDALEKRRGLMRAWESYCSGAGTENVFKFARVDAQSA